MRLIRISCIAAAIAFLGGALTFCVQRASIVARGRWIYMADGSAAPIDELLRGLQTSGLAWDGSMLWSVGDQRAAFPGHLYLIDPKTARLAREPIPLRAVDPMIQSRLDAWSRLDLEDIAILEPPHHRFVAVVEDKAMAALVIDLDAQAESARVTAIWEFQFPGGAPPVPYRNDPNYRLEGIAIDRGEGRGYVAFERDEHGMPHLYQFDVRSAPTSGVGAVQLESLAFRHWDQLHGKPGTRLNANGLDFVRTPSGASRLFVLCRDRELFFVLDPRSGALVGEVELSLRSPDDELIEWVSPEGIAIDSRRGVAYIVTDPDSTDGNYRLRSTAQATGPFAQYVPLLYEVEVPAELLQ